MQNSIMAYERTPATSHLPFLFRSCLDIATSVDADRSSKISFEQLLSGPTFSVLLKLRPPREHPIGSYPVGSR